MQISIIDSKVNGANKCKSTKVVKTPVEPEGGGEVGVGGAASFWWMAATPHPQPLFVAPDPQNPSSDGSAPGVPRSSWVPLSAQSFAEYIPPVI